MTNAGGKPASANTTAAAKKAAVTTTAAATPKKEKPTIQSTSIWPQDNILVDQVPDGDLEKRDKLAKFIFAESVIIGVLALILVAGQPFLQPVAIYFGINEKHETIRMAGLTMPNMTNKAVLSWASTSIVEVMTFGFGDLDSKLLKQKWRFTPDGWDGFVHAFIEQKNREKFFENRLILTTIPTDVPVINSQGPNPDGIYQWVVQMPILMNYATNDNKKTQEKKNILLTIVRSADSPSGIAIQNWSLANN